MKQNKFGRLILVIAGIFIVSGIGIAAEFSADLMQTGPGTLNKGKLYVKGSKIREEISLGRKQIVITRRDKKLVWTLDPVSKTYMKVTGAIIRGLNDPTARARIKKIGVAKPITKEKVNGYLCEKRQWVTKGAPRTTLTEWVSRELGIAVRTEIKSPGSARLIEYKNIKIEKVPDSLFEIPKGYKSRTPPPAPKKQSKR